MKFHKPRTKHGYVGLTYCIQTRRNQFNQMILNISDKLEPTGFHVNNHVDADVKCIIHKAPLSPKLKVIHRKYFGYSYNMLYTSIIMCVNNSS